MVKITFVESNGTEHPCEGEVGMTLMEVAIKNDIKAISADCGGACACATRHVYVRQDWQGKTGQANDLEEDMLDFAVHVKDNSRLSCQIKVTDDLDGIVLDMPENQY